MNLPPFFISPSVNRILVKISVKTGTLNYNRNFGTGTLTISIVGRMALDCNVVDPHVRFRKFNPNPDPDPALPDLTPDLC
jgi:hypothetical protein